MNARQIETLIQRETVHFEEECELITAREKEEAAKAAEPKCISFEDFAVKVMEIKERTGKEKSTLARYQDMLDSRINPYLGKTPVDEITGDRCCARMSLHPAETIPHRVFLKTGCLDAD